MQHSLLGNKSGQNLIEYTLVLTLILTGVLIMQPYVTRSWNAFIKGLDDSVQDSYHDPLIPSAAGGFSVPCTCEMKPPCEDPPCCGMGGCEYFEHSLLEECNPLGCGDSPPICEEHPGCCAPAVPGVQPEACGAKAPGPCDNCNELGKCADNQVLSTITCADGSLKYTCLYASGCGKHCVDAHGKIIDFKKFERNTDFYAGRCFEDDVNLESDTPYTTVAHGKCSIPPGTKPKCQLECAEGMVPNEDHDECVCPGGGSWDPAQKICLCNTPGVANASIVCGMVEPIAICSKPSSELRLVRVEGNPNNAVHLAPSFKKYSGLRVDCPDGFKVLSGGYTFHGWNNSWDNNCQDGERFVHTSKPTEDGKGWETKAKCFIARPIALCVEMDSPPQLEITIEEGSIPNSCTVGAGGKTGSLSVARCDPGYTLVGGGHEYIGVEDQKRCGLDKKFRLISSSAPQGNEWRVHGEALYSQAYALCMKNEPFLETQRIKGIPEACSVPENEVTALCPAEFSQILGQGYTYQGDCPGFSNGWCEDRMRFSYYNFADLSECGALPPPPPQEPPPGGIAPEPPFEDYNAWDGIPGMGEIEFYSGVITGGLFPGEVIIPPGAFDDGIYDEGGAKDLCAPGLHKWDNFWFNGTLAIKFKPCPGFLGGDFSQEIHGGSVRMWVSTRPFEEDALVPNCDPIDNDLGSRRFYLDAGREYLIEDKGVSPEDIPKHCNLRDDGTYYLNIKCKSAYADCTVAVAMILKSSY